MWDNELIIPGSFHLHNCIVKGNNINSSMFCKHLKQAGLILISCVVYRVSYIVIDGICHIVSFYTQVEL